MSDEIKNRIIKSIAKYQEKQIPKAPRAKPNGKPEEKVVKEILAYFRGLGFSLNVVEAKASFSETAQAYRSSTVKAGFADLVGNSPMGLATYIEVKSKGRRSTLREDQRIFLIDKIKTNSFAICADSVQYCQDIISKFKSCSTIHEKQDLLLKALPSNKRSLDDDAPIFED